MSVYSFKAIIKCGFLVLFKLRKSYFLFSYILQEAITIKLNWQIL